MSALSSSSLVSAATGRGGSLPPPCRRLRQAARSAPSPFRQLGATTKIGGGRIARGNVIGMFADASSRDGGSERADSTCFHEHGRRRGIWLFNAASPLHHSAECARARARKHSWRDARNHVAISAIVKNLPDDADRREIDRSADPLVGLDHPSFSFFVVILLRHLTS